MKNKDKSIRTMQNKKRKMRRSILNLLLATILAAFALSSCGSSENTTMNSESTVNSNDSDTEESNSSSDDMTLEESEDNPTETSSGPPVISMDDIEWTVRSSVLDGERYLSLDFTNNTAYTMIALEIKFVLKDDVTEEELSVFDNLKETYDYTDDDILDIYIQGYNYKIAEPGKTSSNSPCTIKNTSILAEMDQYELMQPDIATIVIIGDDNKLYLLYYDFLSDSFGSSSEEGIDLYTWSDSDLVNTLPQPDVPVLVVSSDDEDYFFAYAYGVSADDYDTYVQACKENGFDTVDYEGSSSFHAVNGDGHEVYLYYSSVMERMSIRLEE